MDIRQHRKTGYYHNFTQGGKGLLIHITNLIIQIIRLVFQMIFIYYFNSHTALLYRFS